MVSSSSNDSLLVPHNSSVNPVLSLSVYCFFSSYSIILRMYNITSISLLLPLCIFILHHGLQQWRKARSPSSAAISHSESFTYHLVTMEIFSVFGSILNVCALYTYQPRMLKVGLSFPSVAYMGELFFHILTCLERYLAVVHPITYLSLRTERGIRIRNICIGCVWLLSSLGMGFIIEDGLTIFIPVYLFLLILSLMTVSFCSVSVLCVLIHPGPGEQGGSKEKVDKSKQRAFYTIMAILGVLVTRLVWDVVSTTLYISKQGYTCLVYSLSFWVYIPSSLALPLLFLLTKEKLRRKGMSCRWRCRK